jgi:hypothetical protein
MVVSGQQSGGMQQRGSVRFDERAESRFVAQSPLPSLPTAPRVTS